MAQIKRIYARLILLIFVALVLAIFLVFPALSSFTNMLKGASIGSELFSALAGTPFQLTATNIQNITVNAVTVNSSVNSTTVYL